MKKVLSIILAVLMFANIGYATTLISLPNTYSSGSKAKASEANANEQHIQTQVNTHNAATTGEHGADGTILDSTSPTMASPTINTACTINGDTTFATGIKAIFGNTARYLIDSTSFYGIAISTNTSVASGAKLYYDGGDDTYSQHSTSNQLDFYAGGNRTFYIGSTFCHFGSGFTIGTDSANYQFDDSTHGTGSTTMYIGNKTIDTSVVSDKRLKTNIKKTKYGLNDLLKIEIDDFNFTKEYTADTETVHTGAMAQDVQKIYPYAVQELENGNLMIDYKLLVPLLIKSVQEQQEQIDDLKKRIEKLEGK